MRVLFFSQYFAPEVGATQARTQDMVQALLAAGHEITVVCEVPNHPVGRIWPAYRGKLVVRERVDGVDIVRVWVSTSPNKRRGGRIAFYASYMAMAIVAGLLFARGRHDIVFATSPPLLVGTAGRVVAKLRRLPFVFEVRDPWPAAAVAFGELREGAVLSLARWLERRCYAGARHIITVSQGWREHLLAHQVPAEHISLIPNGANLEMFRPEPAAGAALRRQWGISPDAFVLVYAGLHGLAYGFDAVLEAAAQLRDHGDIRFVFVGDGPRKADLQRKAAADGLDRITFHDPVPRESVAALMSMADMALVPLRRVPFLRGSLPAKLFDAWACARPVLAGAEGEFADIVRRAEGGIVVPPEDAGALVAAIRQAMTEKSRIAAMGAAGRQYVQTHFDRAAQARAFVETLERAFAGEPDETAEDGERRKAGHRQQ